VASGPIRAVLIRFSRCGTNPLPTLVLDDWPLPQGAWLIYTRIALLGPDFTTRMRKREQRPPRAADLERDLTRTVHMVLNILGTLNDDAQAGIWLISLNRDRANPVIHGGNMSLSLRHDVASFACGHARVQGLQPTGGCRNGCGDGGGQ
jgi:hypothetical protein